MKLYSFKGGYPSQLPDRVRLNDGTTRTSLHELRDQELTQLGFVEVDPKPETDATQVSEWVNSQWTIRERTPDELAWEHTIALLRIRSDRNRLLENTDKPWGLADFRANQDPEVVAAWDAYRQALRDLPENTEDPFNPIWPTPPS